MSLANLPNTTETCCVTVTYLCITNKEFIFFQPLPKSRLLRLFSKNKNLLYLVPSKSQPCQNDNTVCSILVAKTTPLLPTDLRFSVVNLKLLFVPNIRYLEKKITPKYKLLYFINILKIPSWIMYYFELLYISLVERATSFVKLFFI